MIRFDRVTKRFGTDVTEVCVLNDFSLDVPQGQFCIIMGPSGAGKSTTLHLLAGLTSPTSGEVHLGDRNLATMSERGLALVRRRDVGFVFQFFHLLSYLDAGENVALPLFMEGFSAAAVRQRVDRALDIVGLSHRRRHKPAQLSGGEMQRVAIARALVIEPRVLLADEPTGNLDSNASHGVMQLLRRSNEQLGVTILMVTHDPVCASYGDRVIRLVDGRVVEDIDVREQTPNVSLRSHHLRPLEARHS